MSVFFCNETVLVYAINELVFAFAVGSTTVREFSLATLSIVERNAPVIGTIARAVFAVILLTICIMLLMSRTTLKQPRLGSCTAPACNRAINYLESLLDDAVDPCQDLYNHVCGKWLETADEGLDFIDYAARLTLYHVNSGLLYETVSDTVVPRAVQPVAQFLKLCWHYVNSDMPSEGKEALGFAEMSQYADIGKVSNTANFLEQLVRLSLARGLVTIIGMKLLRSTNGANQLNLLPGQSIAQKMEEPMLTDEILEYIRGLVARSNFSRRLDASSIFTQDRHMQNFLSSPISKKSYKLIVLGSLSKNFSTDNWISALNSILAEDDKVGSLSTIKVHGLNTIEGILAFFLGLADYGTAYIYVQILIDAFRFDFIRRSAQRRRKSAKICLKATLDVMRQTPFVIGTEVLGWPSDREGDVSVNILRDVVTTAMAEGNIVWMTSYSKRRVRALLGSALIYAQAESLTGVPSVSVEEFNASLATDNFPAIYMRLKSKQRDALLKTPLHETEDIYTSRFMDSRVLYDSDTNAVFVPAALREEPIAYTAEVPAEYSIAILGALLGRELIRALFSGSEVKDDEWSIREFRRIRFYQDCVGALARSVFNMSLEEIHGNGSDIAQWVLAAHLAHGTLRSKLEKFERRPNWNEYWVQAQRVFFRRFCLMSCTAKEKRYKQAARIRCILPSINIPDFPAGRRIWRIETLRQTRCNNNNQWLWGDRLTTFRDLTQHYRLERRKFPPPHVKLNKRP
ncbi:hypothetical protein HPB49_008484 [Dermacentor silvarum]|uniref:Uncharacterized protein n=1 Tax=Dermacentor silvarum TaxID=543639 RepID=A0ACB8DBU3_DERSI|nr:hypothetical protein HPB49_008484 [Dermacentor silvarum]